MDRRPGGLGAPRCRCACSACAAGHTRCDRDAQHLCPAHHYTQGPSNDDSPDADHDDSPDASHDEARCHLGRDLGPLGRPGPERIHLKANENQP
jgi:hypothetical protein